MERKSRSLWLFCIVEFTRVRIALQTVRITETFSEKMYAGFLACLQVCMLVLHLLNHASKKEKERKKNGRREGGGTWNWRPLQTPRTLRPRQKGPPVVMEGTTPRRWCGQISWGSVTASSDQRSQFFSEAHPCLPGSKKQQEVFMKPVLSPQLSSWLLTAPCCALDAGRV